jgi:hypothetical protein
MFLARLLLVNQSIREGRFAFGESLCLREPFAAQYFRDAARIHAEGGCNRVLGFAEHSAFADLDRIFEC